MASRVLLGGPSRRRLASSFTTSPWSSAVIASAPPSSSPLHPRVLPPTSSSSSTVLPSLGLHIMSSQAFSTTPRPGPGQSQAPLKYKYLLDDSLLTEEVPPPVKDALGLKNADAPERKQAEKQAWIRQLQLRPGDTGSTPVQVACLTVRIQHMKEHVATNRQDKAARRAYDQLLSQRRRLLQYLRRKDFLAYRNTLQQLGIIGFK